MPAALAAVLRAKAGASKSGDAFGLNAPMRDVFQYIDNQGTGTFFSSPNEQSGGEAGMGSSATTPWQTITHGAGDNAWTEQVPGVDPKFADMVRFSSNAGHSNEGSGGWRAEVDGSKLPTTRFGDVTRTAPVNAHTPLFNPALAYDDPQYGRITDARNVRPDKLNQMVGMMLPSLAMSGIGALAAPAAIAGGGLFGGSFNPATLGIGAVNAARGFGSGGLSGGLSGILGALGSSFGLPSWATSAGRIALAEALRNQGGKS